MSLPSTAPSRAISLHARARRIARRRQQRGAAVFVVVLVITLLTALGVYAVRSSTSALQASGFNRQLTQVHYVTDFAVIAAVADISSNPQAVADQMMKGPPPGDVVCNVYASVLQPTCWTRSYDDIQATVQQKSSGNHVLMDTTSLGQSNLQADMKVELTDLHPALPVRGNQVAGGSTAASQQMYVYVTVSADGLVRPAQTIAGTWDTASATAAGTERARAHVFMGPVLMQK
ncbi:MAG: hypothetical protein KC731_14755 [Myxococcales bacterium]|nr:hypothetical protein [Myxococcales bacterium]